MLAIQKSLSHLLTNYKKPRFELLKEYRRTLSLPLNELLQSQENKLRALLQHAYEQVPYYRSLLEESDLVHNGVIVQNPFKYLFGIPLLTKQTIRQNGEALYSRDRNSRNPYSNRSSGSTGKPLQFLCDAQYAEEHDAHLMLIKSWRGADPFDSVIKLWGAIRDTYRGKKPLDIRIKDFLRNRLTLNTFNMTVEDMRRYLEILNKHRPNLIWAYANSIYELARFAKREGIAVLPQRAIHVSAETLHDFMREEIEEVFGCKVFNHYGSREISSIASECSAHQGLHILIEYCLVEVLDEYGKPCPPGVEGNIVVTNLGNYSMPFIRYVIEDRGVMAPYAPCSCGCNYPKLKRITGRTLDLFLTEDGKMIDGLYLMRHIYGTKKREQYQIIQKDYHHLVYRIVANAPVAEKVLEEIREKTQLVMGLSCRVEFEFVDKIPTGPTGKFHFVVNELDKTSNNAS